MELIMAIFKSRTLAFIAKFMLLLPLSCFTAHIAFGATGGGHGNFLPAILFLGPLTIPLGGGIPCPLWEEYLLLGTPVCLYVVYALLLKFVKSSNVFRLVLIFHLSSSVIGMLFCIIIAESLLGPIYSLTYTVRLLVLDISIFGLFALLFWILGSIRDANNSMLEQREAKTKWGKTSLGCFCALCLFMCLFFPIIGDLEQLYLSSLSLVIQCLLLAFSISVALVGIIKKESPRHYCIIGGVFSLCYGLLLLTAVVTR